MAPNRKILIKGVWQNVEDFILILEVQGVRVGGKVCGGEEKHIEWKYKGVVG